MRAITIAQPFASLIICGAKRYEARTWNTRHRGPLAIHAALSPHPKLPEYFYQWRSELRAAGFAKADQLPLGAFVGVVDVVACRPAVEVMVTDYDLALTGDTDYCYLSTLANERPLRPPLRARGAQSLWIPTEADAAELRAI